MPLIAGQKLGAYEIVAPLGAGGMGEVYRARDSKLGRHVALKILPPDVTNEPGRLERFDREARAIAALNHPHIVTIYSTEHVGEVRFLTMELVDGATLSDLVMTTGMAIPRFLEIAMPLADALAAAHQKQITHRDLKPGNVMVSNDGRVKVLDFGLARVGGGDGGEQTMAATVAPITHQGMIVGTMPYMSPEQVEGRPSDARSDLFSLGVIFYELLSGDRPFKGASSPALMSAILRDTPSSLTEKRSDVPEALDRLVSRLMEKRQEDRVQTARDVFNELKHVQRGIEGAQAGALRSGARAGAQNLWIAVLPFTVRGSDPDAESIAAGLTDDVAASLAKFAGLSVVASQSTRAFKDSPLDVRQIADRLHARYIVTGQVRKSGGVLRTTAQVIDASTGEQLWTEHYNRRLEQQDAFAIQDDVADHIVATVADKYGVLARSMVEAVHRSSSIKEATASQLLVYSWAFQHRPQPDTHAALRSALEAQLAIDPNNAQLWAELANMYVVEHSLWLNPMPDPIGRAVAAARRSVEIDRTSQSGWLWLAVAHFHQHDRDSFEEACDRAVRINPRSAYNLSWMGNILTHAGEYQRGCALTERSMAINPAHPGWLHFAVFNRHFAAGEYGEALQAAKRANMRDFFWMYFAVAAACGQLGRTGEGRAAAQEMVRLAPFLEDAANLREFVTRWYWPEDVIESLLEGVSRSLDPSAAANTQTDSRVGRPASGRPPSSHASSASSRALSVAVLPFVPRSSDDESKSLADGLTDDIITGLSKFPALRVLSRSTGERLAREHAQVRTHARYVIEGHVRKSGAAIRLSVNLVDADAGANLWTQTYDRDAGAGVFAIQDDVAGTVIATIGDHSGVLTRTVAASLAQAPLETLSIPELVFRYFDYAESFRPDVHAQLRDAFEAAAVREPGNAEAFAYTAMLCEHEYGFGFNRRPDALQRQRAAAERAIELDARSQAAWSAMVTVCLFARDAEGVRRSAERAVALNPYAADIIARCALHVSMVGDFDRALALVEQALAKRPHHPGYYHFVTFGVFYDRGDYERAFAETRLMAMPSMPMSWLTKVAASGQLGRVDEVRSALDHLRRIDPRLATLDGARHAWSLWIPEGRHRTELVNGFSKALALVGTGSAAQGIEHAAAQSIAVLPFSDLSEKKDQDWFCDGIAEEIMTALATLPGVRVAARASAFSFRGKAHDLEAIAEKLNVSTVLEGSVRRAGDRVRITTQLSDARQGRQLWSERFDRELKDIFDVQDEIARAIAERLRVSIGGESRLVPRATTNMEAYELLLRGKTLATRRGPSIVQAAECFHRAVALDPGLVDAHANLGDTYRLMGIYGLLSTRDALAKSNACIERALAMDPRNADVLATLANLKQVSEWDFAAARELTDQALAIDPNHVRALAESSIMTATASAESPAPHVTRLIEERIARARSVDPLNAWVMSVEALDMALIGRGDAAIEASARAIATDPHNFTAQWSRVVAFAVAGRDDEAIAAAESAFAIFQRHPSILAELAAIATKRGNPAAADAIHSELVERAGTTYVGAAVRATIAASAGRSEDAKQLLAAAIEDRDAFLTFYKLPAFRYLRADRQCRDMLYEMGYVRDALK